MLLEIVTPEKKVYSEEVDQVTIPTTEGEITILPHHLDLVTTLKAGELKIKKGNQTVHLAAGDGFAEINGQKVAVITDLALRPEEIDEKAVEEAKKRAQEALRDRERLSEEEFAATAAALQKSLIQLQVKRKHAHSSRRATETSP